MRSVTLSRLWSPVRLWRAARASLTGAGVRDVLAGLAWNQRFRESGLRADYAGKVVYAASPGLLLPVSTDGTAPTTGLITLDTDRRASTSIEADFAATVGGRDWQLTGRFDTFQEWDTAAWTRLGDGPAAGTAVYAFAANDTTGLRFFVRDFNSPALTSLAAVRLTQVRFVRNLASLSRTAGDDLAIVANTAAGSSSRALAANEFIAASDITVTDGAPALSATQPYVLALPDSARGQTKVVTNTMSAAPIRVMTLLRHTALGTLAARRAYTGTDSVLIQPGDSRLVVVAARETDPSQAQARIIVAGAGRQNRVMTTAAYTALTTKDADTFYDTY